MREINLAKDLIMPARRRRTIYRWMLVYLLFCLLLLPVVAYRATMNVREGLRLTADTRMIEQRFLERHPEQKSMLLYANTLRDTLQQDARHAAAVNSGIPSTAHSILPLLDLLLHQGDAGSIKQLVFDQEDRNKRPALEFSLIAPPNKPGADSPAGLKNWQNDPMLIRQFTGILPVVTERANIGSREVQIHRFRAVFKE